MNQINLTGQVEGKRGVCGRSVSRERGNELEVHSVGFPINVDKEEDG